MLDILARAGSFVFIIVLGILLKKIGFFKAEDHRILSKIMLRITLPASIITGFGDKQIDMRLLALVLISFSCGMLYIGIGYLINRKHSKDQQSFEMLNLSGYNIGAFMLPFVTSFLGPMGIVAASIFDIGNSVICLGGAYSLSAMVKDGSGFSFRRILRSLRTSVPFMCYVLMLFMNLTHISLPAFVMTSAGTIGSANAFMAMLTIGVGFRMEKNISQIGTLAKLLAIRYGIAACFALLFYLCLPFELEVRQAMVILAFSPISSAVTAFTGELGGDVGTSSALNSLSIIISIVITVILVTIML